MNLELYGSLYPPKIDLAQIDVPLAMFVGNQDDLGTPEMGRWTLEQLSIKPYYYEIE